MKKIILIFILSLFLNSSVFAKNDRHKYYPDIFDKLQVCIAFYEFTLLKNSENTATKKIRLYALELNKYKNFNISEIDIKNNTKKVIKFFNSLPLTNKNLTNHLKQKYQKTCNELISNEGINFFDAIEWVENEQKLFAQAVETFNPLFHLNEHLILEPKSQQAQATTEPFDVNVFLNTQKTKEEISEIFINKVKKQYFVISIVASLLVIISFYFRKKIKIYFKKIYSQLSKIEKGLFRIFIVLSIAWIVGSFLYFQHMFSLNYSGEIQGGIMYTTERAPYDILISALVLFLPIPITMLIFLIVKWIIKGFK